MADERLRLQAEVKDNMSPALRKIKEQLNSIRSSPSMEAATEQFKKLGVVTANFVGVGAGAGAVLNTIGLGSLAAAGSLAAVVEQMKALGKRGLDMKELARETGVSANWLNVWSHAGLNFGVGSDAMQSAVDSLSEKMVTFRKHFGDLYTFTTTNAANFPGLTNALEGENLEQQFKTILEYADKIKDPQLQKKFLGNFFGNPDDIEKLMRNGAKGFWDEFNKEQKALNPINPDLLKQAQAFREAQTGFTTALENFENTAGPAFLKQMTKLVDAATEVVHLLDPDWDKKNHEQHVKDGTDANSRLDAAAKAFRAGVAPKQPTVHDRQPSQKEVDEWAKKHPANIPQAPSDPHFWDNANPLLHKSAFITGGDSSSPYGFGGIIAEGTKAGVLAAFRELMAANDTAKSAGGGLMQASWEGGGGVGGFGGDDGSAGAGSGSGGGFVHRGGGGPLEDGGVRNERLGRVGGRMAAKAQESYDFWRGLGFTRNQALGFVGNEQGEGTMGSDNPALHWDGSHYSGGLVQWDPPRRKAIWDALKIDVWHDRNHLHQLQAEAWELRKRYPQLWEALKHAKTIGQVTAGLVRRYELPADRVNQPGIRAGYGMAWGRHVHDRAATGLAGNSGNVGSKPAAAAEGKIEAHVHVHGKVDKAHVKSTGLIQAKLTRWPVIGNYA